MSDDGFDPGDLDEVETRLEELRERHRELDSKIAELGDDIAQAFQVMTLKREKLRVKDRITWLTSKMTPDIIA